MVIFGSLLALGTPNNMGMMIAFLVLSLIGYGWSIYLSIAITQMGVKQEQLGTSGGLSGCVRFAGGSSKRFTFSFPSSFYFLSLTFIDDSIVAQAVYLAIFTSSITKWTGRFVPAAAEAAGLPASEITTLLGMIGTPKLATTYDFAIVAAVGEAVQRAYEKGFQ